MVHDIKVFIYLSYIGLSFFSFNHIEYNLYDAKVTWCNMKNNKITMQNKAVVHRRKVDTYIYAIDFPQFRIQVDLFLI